MNCDRRDPRSPIQFGQTDIEKVLHGAINIRCKARDACLLRDNPSEAVLVNLQLLSNADLFC